MDLLQTWQEEQQRIAAQVIIKEDPKEQDDPHRNEAFKYLQNLPTVTNYYYFGGVDVSFPNNESDPSVAVYVILNGSGTIVYRDHEYFHLTIPYVSSYLSYREIDPLERLVNKQRKEQNKFTPCVILVDGNGILHSRRAGIACFLGVRTGIPTIGVGKTLYCEAGLSKEIVHHGIHHCLNNLSHELKQYPKWKLYLQTTKSGLFVDRTFIDPNQPPLPNTDTTNKNTRPIIPIPMKDPNSSILQEIAPLSMGIAIKLKGNNHQILACALLGHGGRMSSKAKCKTQNPIYISVGHNISLEEAVQVCAQQSQFRIPEPIRQADLWGRELMRTASTDHLTNHLINR